MAYGNKTAAPARFGEIKPNTKRDNMKKFATYIAAGMIWTAGSALANSSDEELRLLRELVKQQQAQLENLSKRIEQMEDKSSAPAAAVSVPDSSLETRIVKLEEKTEAIAKDTEARADKFAWAEKMKVKADVRIRFDHDTVNNDTSKNRMRFRARAGVYGNVTDEIYSGIRVASGSDDRATSANQDFTNWTYEKNAWIDLAYLGYTPLYAEGLDLSIGKIKKPWVDVDSMFWDGDVNPEGAAAVYEKDFGPVNLFAHGGFFIVDEDVNDDVTLTSAQLAAKTRLSDTLALRVGSTAFMWDNIDGAAAPGGRTNGNSDDGAGNYATGFQIGQVFSDLTIKTRPAEFKIYGEASKNFDSVDDRDSAWLAGVSVKSGKVSAKYNYRDMENNSTIAFFSDSDFAASNISKGHKIAAKYNFTKNFYLGFTYNLAERKDAEKTTQDTFMFDAVTKF